MTDVFISYARSDRNRVRLIAHALAAEGFSVWWDPDIKPGKKWNKVIRGSLEAAGAVVTCWTPASAKSEWVEAETTSGNQRKALVPVTLKACRPPIPYNMIQSADLTRWRGDGNDPEWRAVLERVRALVEAKRRLIAAAPPPGEAQAAERAPSANADRSFDNARYRPSRTRPRMGPRWTRFALATVTVGAVLTAGLWASDSGLRHLWTAPAPAIQAPPELTPAAPPSTPLALPPAPGPSATMPPVSEAPPPQAAPETPPPKKPPPEQSANVETPATPAPAQPIPPAKPADNAEALAQIDSCASRLVSACAIADGRMPPGFANDGVLSAPERRFLDAMSVPNAPAEDAGAQACLARMLVVTFMRNDSTYVAACRAVVWTAPPAPAPAAATPSRAAVRHFERRVTPSPVR